MLASAKQDWTPQKIGTNSWFLNDIAYGAGQFVTVGDGGMILTWNY